MVFLNAESPAELKGKTALATWEALRRSKHNFYEAQIQQSLQGIQRINNGSFILNWFFPSFAQASLAELEISRRLQKLGDYTSAEVSAYSDLHNSWIKYHLQATFGTPVPYCGGVFGLAIIGYYLPKRWNVFNAFALAALPPLLEVLSAKWNPNHKYQTLKFLDWAIEKRTAEVNLERFKDKFADADLRDFKRAYPNETVLYAYNEYLKRLDK